jgi:hypothetical protein
MLANMEADWKKALEQSIGKEITLVGTEAPDMGEEAYMAYPEYPGDARAFSAVLEKYRDQDIDAWISLMGVPTSKQGQRELEKLALYDWEDPPLGAVSLSVYYDPANVRRWLEDGLLHAVALHPTAKSPEIKAYTRENLSELPSEAPYGGSPPAPGAGQ